MKKYLLSSLLIIMISLVVAEAHFSDMRIGDFGCVTRVVFEFTGKIDYSLKEEGNNLLITLTSMKEVKIQLPAEDSKNIESISITEEKGSTQVKLVFTYPIEVTSESYIEKNKNFLIVFDVYDVGYKTNKEKGLATLLFKGQKFPLSKISSEIALFSEKYATDTLVNLYFGRMFATQKMKNQAIEYFTNIPESSEHFFTAQAYIENLKKFRFPTEEVKPDFLETILPENEVVTSGDSDLIKEEDSLIASNPVTNNAIQTENDIFNEDDDLEQISFNKPFSTKIWYLYFALSIILILYLFIKNTKKNISIKELGVKLESSKFELNALANKLEKGVVENSKTKDKIIIKLFNSGWKPEDIANELNASIEIVEATINRQGRL